MTKRRAAPDYIPLPSPSYYALVALGGGVLHAYAILKEVERLSEGRVRLSASTVYDAVQRLQSQGLIEESDRRPVPALDDGRRRYFALTDLGREVIALEAARLSSAARLARSVLSGPESEPGR